VVWESFYGVAGFKVWSIKNYRPARKKKLSLTRPGQSSADVSLGLNEDLVRGGGKSVMPRMNRRMKRRK